MMYFKRVDETGKILEFGEAAELSEGAEEISEEEFETLRQAHIRPELQNRAYQLISDLEFDIRRGGDLFRSLLKARAPVLIEALLSSIDWDSFLRDHQGDLSRFIASLDPLLLDNLLTIILSQSKMIKLLYLAIEELQAKIQELDPSWTPRFPISSSF
jgi:hypothetical protein